MFYDFGEKNTLRLYKFNHSSFDFCVKMFQTTVVYQIKSYITIKQYKQIDVCCFSDIHNLITFSIGFTNKNRRDTLPPPPPIITKEKPFHNKFIYFVQRL